MAFCSGCETPATDLCSSPAASPLAPVVQGVLFEAAPDSECSDLLRAVSRLACFAPGVLANIERDLDARALEKKRKRLERKRWDEERTRSLIELPDARMENLRLDAGRPRMQPLAVLAFLLLRGWLGGSKDARFKLVVRESQSLRIFLKNIGQAMPGLSTVAENLNALSRETREGVHQAQLALALAEGLDDFASLRIDSTHCTSASAYPTDSGTLAKLVCRICSRLLKLGPLDLPGLGQGRTVMIEESTAKIRRLGYQIGTLSSSSALQAEKTERQKQLENAEGEGAREAKDAVKQGQKAKGESAKTRLRRELYEELYADSEAVLAELAPVWKSIVEQIGARRASPEIQSRREAWRAGMENDHQAAAAVIEQSRRRVCEGKKPNAATGMPLSVSDPAASFIEKGGWERVFGYRPQCAFSAHGLVSALLVPEGNQSDQSQLSGVVDEAISNTGVVPGVVTVDDGYTAEAELTKVWKAGVDLVSFSGARGRALLGEDRWQDERYVQARRDRNAAESGISVLKGKVRFGQLSRTGIEAVRAEQLEKVLALNALRIAQLRKRRREHQRAKARSHNPPGEEGLKVA